MKRFLAALLAALTVFTLTGCGKTENPAEPVTPGQVEEPATPTEPELTPEEISGLCAAGGAGHDRGRYAAGTEALPRLR